MPNPKYPKPFAPTVPGFKKGHILSCATTETTLILTIAIIPVHVDLQESTRTVVAAAQAYRGNESSYALVPTYCPEVWNKCMLLHQWEKMSNLLALDKPNFTRSSPYLLADELKRITTSLKTSHTGEPNSPNFSMPSGRQRKLCECWSLRYSVTPL